MARVRELIDAGADVNVKNKYGTTPLWIASENGHTEIVKLLLGAQADVNAARKTDGTTPLWMASQEGHTEIVKLLLAAAAAYGSAEWPHGTVRAIGGRHRLAQLRQPKARPGDLDSAGPQR